jgi:hypothetical protein
MFYKRYGQSWTFIVVAVVLALPLLAGGASWVVAVGVGVAFAALISASLAYRNRRGPFG